MKIKSSFLILISVGLGLFANVTSFGQGRLFNDVRTLEFREAGNNKNYGDFDGSPYYTTGFRNSTAYMKDGNYANVPLRYDMYRDEMEFIKDEKIFWLIKKDIKYIKYGTEIIIVSSLDTDTTNSGYFFLKDSGKFQLFYKKSVLFQPYVQPEGYKDSKPNRFEPVADKIYIRKGDAVAVKIESRRDLLSYFEGDKAALDFIKKNKIKANDVINLHLLISYLNGL
jgi:hypothetical protein